MRCEDLAQEKQEIAKARRALEGDKQRPEASASSAVGHAWPGDAQPPIREKLRQQLLAYAR